MASDSMIVVPRKLIDWQGIKAEYFTQNEFQGVTSFLRNVKHWDDKRLRSGNTFSHTQNWGSERAAYRQQILDKKVKRAQEQIQLIKPDIMKAKMDIIVGYLEMLEKGELQRSESFDFIEVKGYKRAQKKVKIIEWYKPLTLRERSHILTKLKTELGEPAIITKNNVEDVTPFDPIAYLIEAYGITQNGKLNLDDSVRPHTVIEG